MMTGTAAALPELFQHPDPVEFGEHDVEDDHFGTEMPGLLDAFQAVVGATHRVPQVLEFHLDKARYVLLVLDDEDSGPGHHAPLSSGRLSRILPAPA